VLVAHQTKTTQGIHKKVLLKGRAGGEEEFLCATMEDAKEGVSMVVKKKGSFVTINLQTRKEGGGKSPKKGGTAAESEEAVSFGDRGGLGRIKQGRSPLISTEEKKGGSGRGGGKDAET